MSNRFPNLATAKIAVNFAAIFKRTPAKIVLGIPRLFPNPKHSFICTGFGVKRDGSAAL
jgi:hypothetical protein